MSSGWDVKVVGFSTEPGAGGTFPLESRGGERRENWMDPNSPCCPGWRAIFFPRVTQLLGAPQSAGTYFINTHLLECCLQHLEVVNIFML